MDVLRALVERLNLSSRPRQSKRRNRKPDSARDTANSYAPIRPALRSQEQPLPLLTPIHEDSFLADVDADVAGLALEQVVQHQPPPQQQPQAEHALAHVTLPSPSLEKDMSFLPNVKAPGAEDISPEVPSTVSYGPSPTVGYLGGSELLRLFEPDYRRTAATTTATDQQLQGRGSRAAVIIEEGGNLPPVELQQSFAESYFNYCWPWCPVLDKQAFYREADGPPSHLLVNALALLGMQIRPPIMQHARAKDYYDRAKMLFYMDEESSALVCLQSIMLFYWWAPRGPSQVHKDASWWWTGVAIKYAQQMGLHREPSKVEDVGGAVAQGLRRRIWWTLFARERLTAMCQGRPLTISPEDCNVREPSLEDFGPSSDDPRAEIFIHWVRLCDVIGRVSQHLSRPTEGGRSPSFPTPLAEQLIAWAANLPAHLRLPDMSDRSRQFDRDVLKLHLPYLTTVTILHLNWSYQHPSQPWPEAYTAAVLSASCVTRIFKNLLARGKIRFLGAIACWYVSTAIVALLHTQRIETLAGPGANDIRVLRLALNELANLWPTTAIFVKGFDRLGAFEQLANAPGGGDGRQQQGSQQQGENPPRMAQMQQVPQVQQSGVQRITPPVGVHLPSNDNPPLPSSSMVDVHLQWPHGIEWQSYFPHVTTRTCGLAEVLLSEQHQPPGDVWSGLSLLSWFGLGDTEAPAQFQNLFDPTDTMFDPFLENLASVCWMGESGGTF
ncbi:hypothetical protein LTS07_010184 [Exophiala sideris]|uniref:Xylanolytic transcriptional activator regulatory domain-containing protein n=1 Tax=Exophiala sideris TaxID=1016849 RepID=A0ABR0IXZ7_9EURO|nr:hypothetical protein LTS07_010184 [Exophiala sideris]KAK5027120.1 hypothetical protein LTR13_009730 [Exophiala sideris]KAK5051695.1 hypothetical protein LTR69_010195 [Exophiala sideris]KAK5177660.1 hypothetical protein LTR44_009850 [Eurotiomycetes sp. CCFEE 6388]